MSKMSVDEAIYCLSQARGKDDCIRCKYYAGKQVHCEMRYEAFLMAIEALKKSRFMSVVGEKVRL